ncbi:MAG: GlsB/YeaQ/YmgE family stress response membrane protein [Thermomicrobiales bacterium]|nr:GlsB/YeaQ/YmgE family stress response membrane protein [Thermomicrobiales bacterium]MCO5224605.1 GlsB/YeaQ/YmgE family stress response membrane protein [Thermomicrobiales bacterium]MCO5227370.1 GlsB/YeaQ/YmgE family stress response membrane protein [Thermomicrobiales bacterium]
MSILWWLIVGVAAGWLAGVITGTNRNIVGDLVLGLVGAFVAGLLTDQIGGNMLWSIIVAAIFAALLVVIKNMLMKER